MALCYEVVLDMDELEDGTHNWLVTTPHFPEVTTFGDNQEEAVRQGLSAIEEALAGRIVRGESLPKPLDDFPKSNGHYVEISGLVLLKCSLYMICRDQGITRADLVRRLGVHREQVDRLFRLDHNSKWEQIEAALEAVGAKINLRVTPPTKDAA